MARLSTHVLDTANGVPAAGVRVTLHRFNDADQAELIADRITNAEGRTDSPLLSGESVPCGRYRLTFHAGDYFRGRGTRLPEPPFVDVVDLRFGIADPAGHYHVPLLVSPWSYSTYRGS
ncbi:MAG: hydroxyisourate hydrolase [Casimicrobiaceae bacterium]